MGIADLFCFGVESESPCSARCGGLKATLKFGARRVDGVCYAGAMHDLQEAQNWVWGIETDFSLMVEPGTKMFRVGWYL